MHRAFRFSAPSRSLLSATHVARQVKGLSAPTTPTLFHHGKLKKKSYISLDMCKTHLNPICSIFRKSAAKLDMVRALYGNNRELMEVSYAFTSLVVLFL